MSVGGDSASSGPSGLGSAERTGGYSNDDLERVVSAYFTRLFRWILPILLVIAGIVLVETVLPAESNSTKNASNGGALGSSCTQGRCRAPS
jgi:hypothetical protein